MQIRPLERNDLPFIHQLDNHQSTMALWFEEPYESIDELNSLYDKHIHDISERRFVIDLDGEFAGVIELVEIDYIHRTTEIQIIVRKAYQGRGLAKQAIRKALNYAFNMLNMHKVYLMLMSIIMLGFISMMAQALSKKAVCVSIFMPMGSIMIA